MTYASIKLLLLQIRNPGDPMRRQEIECFASSLGVDADCIQSWDLLSGRPGWRFVNRHDAIFIGGSGDYSVTRFSGWLDASMDLMREIASEGKPTFASCWGFQAMAKSLCGKVSRDLSRAEIGTHKLQLTREGLQDPLFGNLGERFNAQMGHEDCVDRLPEDAVLLASSDIVKNQAYRIGNKPIWCTQFHPELTRNALLTRVLQYPAYIENIAGIPAERFAELIDDAPETERLLRKFLDLVLQ